MKFDPDSRAFQILSRFTELVLLQLLFLLTCIPILTAGAGLTALFAVTRKLRHDAVGGVAKAFFREFAANWKKATPAWLIVLAVAVLLYLDITYYTMEGTTMNKLSLVVVILLAVVVYLDALYLFPMLAWLDQKLLPQMRNALLLSVAHFLTTFLVTVIYGLAAILARYLLPLFLLIGISAPIYLSTGLLERALAKQAPDLIAQYQPPTEDE